MRKTLIIVAVGVVALLALSLLLLPSLNKTAERRARPAAPPVPPPTVAAPPRLPPVKATPPAAANGTLGKPTHTLIARQPATAARPRDGAEDVDAILNTLASGNIAFNAPDSLNLDETREIQLLLDLRQSIEALGRQIDAAGKIEGARIKVSDRMEARLSGLEFEITAVTPEIQAISQTEKTTWVWEVRPKALGEQHLHLTLSALIAVDGASTERTIRTFDRVITVQVTWSQVASDFIENNWQWLWATIVVPIAGWLWQRKRRRRR